MPQARIQIGTVYSVNPARRELRIQPARGQDCAFDDLEWIRLSPAAGGEVRCRVAEVRRIEGGVVAALTAGVTKDLIAGLKGAAVVIAEEERRPRPDGAWDVAELAGLAVFDETGRQLGVVRDTYATGGNDVLEIDKGAGATLLLPAIAQVIIEVDLEGGRLVVGDIAPYAVGYED